MIFAIVVNRSLALKLIVVRGIIVEDNIIHFKSALLYVNVACVILVYLVALKTPNSQMIYVFSRFIHCFSIIIFSSIEEIFRENMNHLIRPHPQFTFHTFVSDVHSIIIFISIDHETSGTFIEWKINQQPNSIAKCNTKFQNKCRFECIRSIGFNVIGTSKANTFVKRSFN